MKKLISILTISILVMNVPAPLLANTVLTRDKRDVGTLTSNSNNDYLSIKEFKNIRGDIYRMTIDTNDNIYFSVFVNGAYVLKHGETTPIKIDRINNVVNSITFDSSNNIYFGTANGAYKLSAESDTPTKINGINSKILFVTSDSKDNIYFGLYQNGAYVLKHGETTPTKIDGISENITSIAVDNDKNIYFALYNNGAFVLKNGSDTPTKFDGISDSIQSIAVDSKDNIYFGTKSGAFVLKNGSDTPTKFDGISDSIQSIAVDSKDNIYFGTKSGAFVLKQGEIKVKKFDGISDSIQSIAVDSKDNIFFGTDKGVYFTTTVLEWLKQQSKFVLANNTKTMTWTHPDLLSVGGELNIDINNPNIDKVVFDNVQQPQTSKHWTINVKPEIAPRDHNLQVMFTLDGKQYTSQITVSMQAKIDPPSPNVKENLSNVIKFDDKNNLGNIIDNNESNIFAAITQKNARIVDFSQITIEKKDNHSATLTAKKDSKSYAGSVTVKYNIVTTTVVDLKINLQATSPTMQVHIDYVGQIDTSNITNPVNTFYYANSESKITLVKSTESSVITGAVYGCDDNWNKTSQSKTIDPTVGILLFGSQLETNDGKYVVELSDNLGHTNNIYLQIAPKQAVAKYFDTDNGKQFEIWAKANGYDNIRGYSASQLNKLFAESKNWQQLVTDSQMVSALAKWFKTNGKLSSKEPLTAEQVEEQLKTKIPNTITIDEKNTILYDPNNVSFELNQSDFKPNDKVNIVVKYNNATSEQFTLQIKDSNTPNDNTKKSGLTGWTIVGIAVGSIAGLVLLAWLFKKFVITPFILEPIRKKKAKAFAEKTAKDIAQMKKDDEEWEAKQRGDK